MVRSTICQLPAAGTVIFLEFFLAEPIFMRLFSILIAL